MLKESPMLSYFGQYFCVCFFQFWGNCHKVAYEMAHLALESRCEHFCSNNFLGRVMPIIVSDKQLSSE